MYTHTHARAHEHSRAHTCSAGHAEEQQGCRAPGAGWPEGVDGDMGRRGLQVNTQTGLGVSLQDAPHKAGSRPFPATRQRSGRGRALAPRPLPGAPSTVTVTPALATCEGAAVVPIDRGEAVAHTGIRFERKSAWMRSFLHSGCASSM